MEKYLTFLKICFSLFFIAIILDNNCCAYNSERCEQYVERYKPSIYTGAVVSLSQSTFSTGECALFFDRAKEIENYFGENYEMLKIDVARGSGEYLNGFTTLLSCNKDGENKFNKYVQQHFSVLFKIDSPEKLNGKELYEKFRQVLLPNKWEFSGCVI